MSKRIASNHHVKSCPKCGRPLKGNGAYASHVRSCAPPPPPSRAWEVSLWEAIHAYVRSCHGDPEAHVYGNIPRMDAVVAVGKAIRAHQDLDAATMFVFGEWECVWEPATGAWVIRTIEGTNTERLFGREKRDEAIQIAKDREADRLRNGRG